ncbi:DUF262 domain-containing HNH endonuclease family protein [Rhodanobacter denitrificans]|uniref:GmrSD restriction endonuclease domain-containing protein n=1 Tax=Rhodanobacter TaxID=75309 RepID=UPI000260CC45|nr:MULTISPECIES: DUF262 domain-containing protein [Rhodanobacter]EIM04279.1 hypothetical protein UUC_03625 [Rhodanobacter denitrificans]UJM88988.1 DUF262 domain-containing HNH endonuclease family protein [Rhodanobacter denitrificans]
MKSETWTIQQVFQDRKQYKVPFYQRAYVWTLEKQWPLLWADIKDKAEERLANTEPAPHFLGAIVVEPQDKVGLRGVDTLHIIDGQQRLTTLQYVLAGIRLATREAGITEYDSYLAAVLDNPNPTTMANAEVEVFKVWPTFSDQKAFVSAMTADKLSTLQARYPAHFTQAGTFRRIGIIHPAALNAIWNFAEWSKTWIEANGGVNAVEALIMAVLADLKVVLIQLEKGDDAQVIFETLNGRGAELHATDLIRNHLFMTVDSSQEDSAALYEEKWKQFEQDRWKIGERRGRITKPRLEWLIFATIRAQTGQEGDLARLYVDFKNFAQGLSTTQQLAMLDAYGKHYLQLIEGKGDLPVARFGRRLQPFDTTTTHPLALRISTADMPDSEKTAMFDDVVSYIVRRAVCGLTPKNYNNWFMSVLRQWIKGDMTRQALKKLLASSPSSPAARWPDDAEFTHAIQTAPTYYGNLDPARCRMLLTELEGWLRMTKRTEEPMVPNLSNLDIDHILPRSWYEHWALPDASKATFAESQAAEQQELAGGILSEHYQAIRRRTKVIPTLGNLTLLNLSVNREAQNKAFPIKKSLLIANTVLSLNGDLMTHETWDEEAIAARARRMAEAATQLYPR